MAMMRLKIRAPRIATAFATFGVYCAAAAVMACGQRATAGSSPADSSLARDLALAKADSASQPRLADTAPAANANAVPAPQAKPVHEGTSHAARHTRTT